MRVFIDKASLSANPGLWTTIEATLSDSEFFILMASPRAAQSVWVQREVERWLALGRADHLLMVLTDGEIVWRPDARDFDWDQTDAVPTSLRGAMAEEPLYIDMRWAQTGTTLSLSDARFGDAVASLASRVRGVPKDDLYGEHVTQQKRFVAFRRAGIAALAVLTVVAVAAAVTAYRERNEARAQARMAEARSLASQLDAARALRSELLPYSALLAVEAMRLFPSIEADQAIRNSLALLPGRPITAQQPSPATALVVQPGGTRIVSAGEDGSIRVWSLDGRMPAQLLDARGRRSPLVVDPDGKRFATLTADGGPRIWDAETVQPITGPLKPEGHILTLTFSVDGRLLAASSLGGGSPGTLSVWSTADGGLMKLIPLERATEQSRGLAFGRDGKLFAAVYADLRAWDSASWKEFPPLERPKGPVGKLLVSRDGTLLAAAEPGGPRVWRATDLRPLANLKFSTQESDLAFSPDGALLAASASGEVRVWKTETWTEIASVRHEGTIRSIAFDPSGTLLATGSDDRTAAVWRVQGGTKRAVMVHGDRVVQVTFSADGRHLVTASADKTVRVWPARGGSEAAQFDHGAPESTASFAPRGDRLTSLSGSSLVTWRAAGADVETIDYPGPYRSLKLCPSGEIVAAAGVGDVVSVFEAGTARRIAMLEHPGQIDWEEFDRRVKQRGISYRDPAATATQRNRADHAGSVRVLACSPGGKHLLTARADFSLRVWDVEARKVVAVRPYEFFEPTAVVSRNGRFAALIKDRSVLEVIALPEGRLALSDHGERLEGAPIVSADSGTLVAVAQVGDRNATTVVRGWRTSDWRALPSITLGSGRAEVVLSADGNLLATGLGSRLVLVFRMETGREVSRFSSDGDVTALAFSADGTRLAVGAGETARVWRLADKRELARLFHRETVSTLTFIGDGGYLITGSESAAQVFSVAEGREVARVPHGGRVAAIFLSADDKYVASVDGATTRIWAWRPEDLVRGTCDRFARDLTVDQWPPLAGEPFVTRLSRTCPKL
jgi:WD40 repeat protein